MPQVIKTRVLIVGGGPVGMTLALDLAWRGIDVVVAETRPANDPPSVKCGQISARGARGAAAVGPDTTWPTPEHTHRVNQKFFEPVLFAHVRDQSRVRILNRTEVDEITQNEQCVTAIAHDLDRGDRISIECTYLVGCDGASSMVRKAI